jgi:hypothetical protein
MLEYFVSALTEGVLIKFETSRANIEAVLFFRYCFHALLVSSSLVVLLVLHEYWEASKKNKS